MHNLIPPIEGVPVVIQVYTLPKFGTEIVERGTRFVRHMLSPIDPSVPQLRVNDLRARVCNAFSGEVPEHRNKLIWAINGSAGLSVREEDNRKIITVGYARRNRLPADLYFTWFTFPGSDDVIQWDTVEFNPVWSETVHFVWKGQAFFAGAILTDPEHRVRIDVLHQSPEGEERRSFVRPYIKR